MNYQDDIPLDQAIAAHRMTSMVPEKRGEQERADYARIMTADRENILKLANTPEKLAAFEPEFARYREGYKTRFLAYLAARSRCASAMITGPANFPTARNDKANASADNRAKDLNEFRERALDAIRKTLCPELRPIMSGDADAVERLKKEIEEADALQSKMKAANAAIRKNLKAGKAAQVAALVALGYSATLADKLTINEPSYGMGFPDYRIRNNGANLKRMRDRLVVLERRKATPDTQEEGKAGRVEVCPSENRVRVILPSRPTQEVISRLKRGGFRWAPSMVAWSAYYNANSLYTAREVADVPRANPTIPPAGHAETVAAPESVPQEAAQ